MTPSTFNPNSALVWRPALLAAGLPVPRTEIVPYRPAWLWPMLDGDCMSEDFLFDQLTAACERVGYPSFLRTDLASAKHEGPAGYKVAREADLYRCVFVTFEDNVLKGIADATSAFLVREFLDIPAAYEAFGGLPIGREWRFFVDQESVLCRHFYWPEAAFEGHRGLPENSKELLQAVEARTNGMQELPALALRAAQSIGHGAWSVDFAQDAAGKWWLIDMATAGDSWHPVHDVLTKKSTISEV